MINKFDGDFAFLSNFYNSSLLLQGKIYPSVEHAYQAAKTSNSESREIIRLAETPAKAKKLGRNIELRKNWDEIKPKVMLNLLRIKFNSNVTLRYLLRNTKTETLIEGNYWHDNYWGDCYCDKCKNIKGSNLLGELLMQVREEIS